jgi:hypothetical protein
MRSLWIPVVGALLVLGCSTTNEATDGTYARCTQVRNESAKISERERQCIRAALMRSNNQIARIAASPDPNSPAELQTQILVNDRDRDLAKCKANADREEEELSACQRVEYQSRAKDQSDRSALIMILTTSRPR